MLSAGALAPYIGFTEAEVKALCEKYNQDFEEVKRWYDVITYLIHLGYLAYNRREQAAFVPNEEIRQELIRAIRRKTWDELVQLQKEFETTSDIFQKLNVRISDS